MPGNPVIARVLPINPNCYNTYLECGAKAGPGHPKNIDRTRHTPSKAYSSYNSPGLLSPGGDAHEVTLVPSPHGAPCAPPPAVTFVKLFAPFIRALLCRVLWSWMMLYRSTARARRSSQATMTMQCVPPLGAVGSVALVICRLKRITSRSQ